jgi:hypothetical protein
MGLLLPSGKELAETLSQGLAETLAKVRSLTDDEREALHRELTETVSTTLQGVQRLESQTAKDLADLLRPALGEAANWRQLIAPILADGLEINIPGLVDPIVIRKAE